MKLPLLFLLALLGPAALINAGETADLGNDLTYLRVHSLAEAAPLLHSALAVKRSCVLDLRYASASQESLAALRTALAGHPTDSRLFILVSPSTPTAVSDIIKSDTMGAQITLGVPGSTPSPRIAVRTDVAADRRAYEAFDHGTPLDDLISGKVDKDRFDEAALVKEFKNGNTEAEPPPAPDPTQLKDGTETTGTGDSPATPGELLKDRVLQRALHLHQALLALKVR